ncbi:MAG: hypothetical protein ACJ0PS_00360 [Flavobacteriaceae bacterium]
MKKLFFIWVVLSLSGCNQAPHGIVKYDDEKSKAIVKVFESVAKEDNRYLETIFSKDMFMVNSSRDTIYYKEFISGIENMYELFDNISFDTPDGDAIGSEVETNYYDNGMVWTQIWSVFYAKGNYTGASVSFPFHIAYKWDDDKIIEEYQFFNSTVFENEQNAKDGLAP